jgi:WD40 repeat protein
MLPQVKFLQVLGLLYMCRRLMSQELTPALCFALNMHKPPVCCALCCRRSKSCKYLVTCDDNGLVKLFNYPVVIEEAPHRAYRGHSSHVMCVRFNADDSIVCSAGGKDWGLFQFRCAIVQVPVLSFTLYYL